MLTHTSFTTMTPTLRKKMMRVLSVALLASLPLTGHTVTTDISPIPLYLGSGVEPNIVYVIDDSGSMGLSFIPDLCGEDNTKRSTSSHYNTLYYDPEVTYNPPVDSAGTPFANSDFFAAKRDGYDATSATINLSTSYQATWTLAPSGTGCGDGDYTNTTQAAYYHIFEPTNAGCTPTNNQDEDCYTKVTVSSTSGTNGNDERTNFANWYSYYRTRMLAAKTGSNLAFKDLTAKFRVGYGSLNELGNTVDGITTDTLVRGVRKFEDSGANTYRTDFYNWLNGVAASGVTPLRRSLDDIGQYYSNLDAKGPYSTKPGEADGPLLSCQTNYTILMTDGYWSENTSKDKTRDANTAGAKLNVDGTAGPTITGPDAASYTYSSVSPFSDSVADTLADVAMYYWKNDLAPGASGLINNVSANDDDPAFWQHMVTLSVGLGVPTTQNPTAAFDAIGDTSKTIAWPNPFNGDAEKADDFLHAAVNGRGGFYNAQSPNAFKAAMISALKNVTGRESSAASIATNSTRIDTGTYIYQAKYDSGDWSGKINAIAINPDGSIGSPLATWDGTGNLPNSYTLRKIYTYNGGGVTFEYSSLSPDQQTAMNSSTSLVNYIRGDQSNEAANGGTYRDRTSLLGDIVDSDPWFVGQANYGYSILPGDDGKKYPAFLTNTASRTPMIYIGANDGMLHAYDAETGNEKFSYIPSEVIPNLKYLADINYGVNIDHRYYVNGSPRSGDVYINNNWSTVLVGSTAQGGRSIFALNVTNPDTFTTNNVMWEFNYNSAASCTTGAVGCKDIGYTLSQPSIAKLANGEWGAIFGNGYNSDSQTAQLLIVNIETGKLITAIDTGVGGTTSTSPPNSPNGLSTPLVADLDGNLAADHVYAGDLHGNLWKFDISDPDPTKWDVAIKVSGVNKPLFTASGPTALPDEVQPIFAKPQVGRNKAGGYIVYFGTGKYFEKDDNIVSNPPEVMTFYGIFDSEGVAATTVRSDLLQQTITYEDITTFTDADGNSVDQYARLISKNGMTSGKKGWFIDLISAEPAVTNLLGTVGERVISEALVWTDRIIFVTLIPNDDACSFGGDSWIMEVDPQSGGQLAFSVFDLNKDGKIDDLDKKDGSSGTVVSGTKRSGIIKRPAAICTKDACNKYTSSSSGKVDVVKQKIPQSTGRQSWQQLSN